MTKRYNIVQIYERSGEDVILLGYAKSIAEAKAFAGRELTLPRFYEYKGISKHELENFLETDLTDEEASEYETK